MNAAQQIQGSQKRVVFGRRLLLPTDTAVQIVVGRLGGSIFPDGSVRYDVGLEATLSHANLPRRIVFGGGLLCGFYFPVVSNLLGDPIDQKKQARTWQKEHQRINPIFTAMEDSFIEQYLAGEVRFSVLRNLFLEKYGQSAPVSKRVGKPK